MQILLFFPFYGDELILDGRFLYSYERENHEPFCAYDYLVEMFFSFIMHLPEEIKNQLKYIQWTVLLIIRKNLAFCQLPFQKQFSTLFSKFFNFTLTQLL